MEEGAFALIDCLGFKGVWKRADPSLLLQKFSQIEQTVIKEISEDESFNYFGFAPIKPRIRFLSDTVAISFQYEKKEGETPDEWQKNFLVGLACQVVIQVLDLFIRDEPYLVLRGCITYGQHLSEGNFIVGSAVDEAAEHMDVAEGAFIWLLPHAAIRYRSFQERTTALLTMSKPNIWASSVEILQKRGRDMAWAVIAIEKYGHEAFGEAFLDTIRPFAAAPTVIYPYDMPLKSGARLRCPVLNPLAFHRTAEERSEIIERYSRVISGNQIGIWLKHQHTMELLEVADRQCAKFEETIGEMAKTDTEQNEPTSAQTAPTITPDINLTLTPSPTPTIPEGSTKLENKGNDPPPQ